MSYMEVNAAPIDGENEIESKDSSKQTITDDIEANNDENNLEDGLVSMEMQTIEPLETTENDRKLYATRLRAASFAPRIPPNSPTILSFSHLTVTSKANKKILLNDVSGTITGGFWAIMGASGGGKTTLLSTLSLRLHPSYMDISGEFRLNGRKYDRRDLKQMSAYVMQDDLLHAEFTVEETLHYAAQLRMPAETTPEARKRRIDEVLSLMGIEHCRNVLIGNTRKKGISGGERKRVSIAIELLNKPKLIFLDEPTSGLDSSTAFIVCEVLKKLSETGECTVVCTIHQPQPKIFHLFDNIILVKKGTIVYQGGINHLEKWLLHINHPCPSDMSMADHLLEVIAPSGDEQVSHEKWSEIPVNLSLGEDKQWYSSDGARSWFDSFTILVERNFKQYYRNYDIIVMNLIATIILAIFIGNGFWHQIGDGQESIRKRLPSLFFCCVSQGVIGSFQAVNSFPAERAIMLRERQSGSYGVTAYFLAKSLVDIITMLWQPILFACIVYPSIGYQQNSGKFATFVFFMFLDCTAAVSYATAVTCYCLSVERSTVVLAVFFEMSRLFGGFFASPAIMKTATEWKFIEVFSYLQYTFLGVALNELTGLDLKCDTGTSCSITSGEQIIETNDYDTYTIGDCIGVLIGLIVGLRFLAYLGLRLITV